MAQSHIKNYQHIVFSTKHRQNLILPEIENLLFDYIGGTCNELDSPSIIVGGYLNHIHVFCMQSKHLTISQLVEKIKSHSSKWIKTQGYKYKEFYWQRGYGAFSISYGHFNRVRNYIANQKQHHGGESYEMEYIRLLIEHNAEYDERYLWD